MGVMIQADAETCQLLTNRNAVSTVPHASDMHNSVATAVAAASLLWFSVLSWQLEGTCMAEGMSACGGKYINRLFVFVLANVRTRLYL